MCLLVAACSRGGDAPPVGQAGQEAPSASPSPSAAASGQGVSVDFVSMPDPPKAGANTFEAVVRQADGSPVADATVTAVFSMPAMPSMNMPAMHSDATLTPVGEGRYRGTGELSMGGTWNVAVTVARGGQQLAVRKLSIVAK